MADPPRLGRQVVITFAAMKGGAGKSTLAVALACEWHRRGYLVALVDGDIQQRTTMKWAERRKRFGLRGPPVMVFRPKDHDNIGEDELRECVAGLDDYEIVIIDSPGQLGSLPVYAIDLADLVLMPCSPEGVQVETLEHTFAEVQSVIDAGRDDLRAYVVICQKDAKTVIANMARKVYDEQPFEPLETELDRSREYGSAHEAGLGVTTWRPSGKASRQLGQLVNEIEKLLQFAPARRKAALRVV